MVKFSEDLIIIVNMSDFRNKYPAVRTEKYIPAVCAIELYQVVIFWLFLGRRSRSEVGYCWLVCLLPLVTIRVCVIGTPETLANEPSSIKQKRLALPFSLGR